MSNNYPPGVTESDIDEAAGLTETAAEKSERQEIMAEMERDRLDGVATNTKPIPRALFSCSNKFCAAEEQSFYADQLYWHAPENRWVCEFCFDNLPAPTDGDGTPTRGITLAEYIIGGDFKAVELLKERNET